MKFATNIVLVLPMLGLASAAFPGSNEEFMNVIEAGNVPEGLGWVGETEEADRNLRSDRDLQEEPGKAGDSCGNRRECAEGLECVRAGLGRVCVPDLACINNAIEDFSKEEGLDNYGEMIMGMVGLLPEDTVNRTAVENGGLFRTIANAPEYVVRQEAREAIGNAMVENPPNLGKLMWDVRQKCGRQATESGITLMLGFMYEIALIAPKFYNSYYFAIGTGDVNFTPKQEPNRIEYNVTAGVFADTCGGVGPDIGIQIGAKSGLALTGTKNDLNGCSFLFDCDIALATGVGAAVGVNNGVTRFIFDVGAGIGGGIGFQGCGTCELSEIAQAGALDFPDFPTLPPTPLTPGR